jgi:glycosyltransferase involved in cell wall biosynthesis
MKIAIIHDWFYVVGGAEKLLKQILNLYPSADLFMVCGDIELISKLKFHPCEKVKFSFIQKLPFVNKKYRSYLPLMPLAIEQFDLAGYDLIISSSHAVAKGVLTGPDQVHIGYIHSPIRYAWDLQHQYLRESNLLKGFKGLLAKIILHKIRIWDYRTAAGVDCFVANSNFISRRIKKVYGANSKVIFPPVNVRDFDLCIEKEDYYLAASRLVPYKRMDLIVEAFSQMPDKKLIVIGDGPEMSKLTALATSNVKIMGYQSFSVLREKMRHAKAFVFAAEEDFGIAPVEAQACGTPVIAYGKGGALETVLDGMEISQSTGVFFHEQSVASIREAVFKFETVSHLISPLNCRKNAERFSVERFRSEFSEFVNSKIH